MEVKPRRLFVATVLLLACSSGAYSQKASSYAIVEGTVFRDPGLAVPDAKVILELKSAKDAVKFKKQEQTTNYRGEFHFNVPAVEAVYVVRTSMKGFRGDEKEAAITGGGAPGQERAEVNLVLEPESK